MHREKKQRSGPRHKQQQKRKQSPENTSDPYQSHESSEKGLATRTNPSHDYSLIFALVFGGCCSNVCSFESLLRVNSSLGSTITFGQMLFVALQSLPDFFVWHETSAFPRLKPRQVPLYAWLLQVLVLTSGNLLNNWAFAYDVPIALQIVFRSSGLPVSMVFGSLILRRKYTVLQMASVGVVSFGVLLATISNTPSSRDENSIAGDGRYYSGITMLACSLILTGILGVLQERTYKKYGPCWKEGVFYTHLLSLPTFLLILGDLKIGVHTLYSSSVIIWMIFFVNLMTQAICVSGVNMLASRVSSVSTNLVLTIRKALSLSLSLLLSGGWDIRMALGALMVFSGSFLYRLS